MVKNSVYFQFLWFAIFSDGTIDLNIPELEYIADHLQNLECRKLIAALHDPNFDIVTNIDAAGKNKFYLEQFYRIRQPV